MSGQLQLKIICLRPLAWSETGEGIPFGLQDKKKQLQSGVALEDDSLEFTCSVTVKAGKDAQPDFAGEIVHGAPSARFLYLTYQNPASGETYRRIKIHLSSISSAQIANAQSQQRPLQARVDGRETGSVRLLDGGWTLADT